jgi:hypothetical protein
MSTAEDESALNPEELARVYDRFVSARWRGEDEAADAFATWFEAHWTGQAPPEPDDPPQGASLLGGSGAGIRWYARNDVVLGYVTGRAGGCYRVDAGEEIPSLTAPWDAVPTNGSQSDRLIDQRVSADTDRRPPRAGRRERYPDQEPALPRTLRTTLDADRFTRQTPAPEPAAATPRR